MNQTSIVKLQRAKISLEKELPTNNVSWGFGRRRRKEGWEIEREGREEIYFRQEGFGEEIDSAASIWTKSWNWQAYGVGGKLLQVAKKQCEQRGKKKSQGCSLTMLLKGTPRGRMGSTNHTLYTCELIYRHWFVHLQSFHQLPISSIPTRPKEDLFLLLNHMVLGFNDVLEITTSEFSSSWCPYCNIPMP